MKKIITAIILLTAPFFVLAQGSTPEMPLVPMPVTTGTKFWMRMVGPDGKTTYLPASIKPVKSDVVIDTGETYKGGEVYEYRMVAPRVVEDRKPPEEFIFPKLDKNELIGSIPPIAVSTLPPRQALPKGVLKIPDQIPDAKPENVRWMNCDYFGGRPWDLNVKYTCTYINRDGRMQTDVFLKSKNPFGVFESVRPEPDFLAINSLNKNNSNTVRVPMNTGVNPIRPAISIPIVYVNIIKSQSDAGKVLLGDNKTPIPPELINFKYGGSSSDTIFMLAGLVADGMVNMTKTPRLYGIPLVDYGSRPRLSVTDNTGGVPSIQEIIQGNPNPGRLPAQSAPTGGFGQPTGGNGSSLSGGGLLGTITDEWSRLGILGGVEWSAYVEIPIFKWGSGPSPVPPPGFTIDGKAYNVYFSLNKIPFAISYTDLNKDGVYEAHILELTGDPKNPNLAGIKQEFLTYQEFLDYVEVLRRAPEAIRPPAR